MFSPGSKLVLGLTGAATAGTVLYAVTQNGGAMGTIGLLFTVLVLGGLAAIIIMNRDANVSAMDVSAVAGAPAGATPAGSSMWPLVAAIGIVLLLIGTITDKRFFVGGLGVLVVAALEWMVRGWADRASSDAAFNAGVRRRMAHPLELPLAGLAGLAVIIFGFSRMMVAVSKEMGPVIFGVGAALVLIFGTLFALRPALRKGLVTGICALGGIAVLAGGVATAAVGERHDLAHAFEEDHFGSRHAERECGEEAGESDEKASETVALKSNILATLTLTAAGELEVDQIGTTLDVPALTIDRGNAVTVLFRNEMAGQHRLRVFTGADVKDVNGSKVTENRPQFCTRAIEEGGTQALLIIMPKPTVAGDQNYNYYADVPGVEGARVDVIVP